MVRFILILFVLQLAFLHEISGQKTLTIWQPVNENDLHNRQYERHIIPETYRVFQADIPALTKELSRVHTDDRTWNLEDGHVVSMPMPNGKTERFVLFYAPVMHPDLAVKYPEIHAYSGYSLNAKGKRIRCDISQDGFHAMIMIPGASDVFIDPYSPHSTEYYVVYQKKNLKRSPSHDFECLFDGTSQIESHPNQSGNRIGGDCRLRRYRLALACIGEYAQYHGGSVPNALAAMHTAMTRVNGIYETDLAVTMQLIPNNDALVFVNPNTDPYTNNSGGTMLGENQTTIDNVIGPANYDIGHVFSTGGGGIASLNAPCNPDRKARGVTGLPNPVNDPFYVDYVAHEMGHQYGANHSFNNLCNGNRVNRTAMEPGSGSTIMSYAGICGPNVQSNSDAYFHAISLEEIYENITGGVSSSCFEEVMIPNTQPVVFAGESHILPVGTPFELIADGTDDDGDNLTYCWEQMDNEIAEMPPESSSIEGPAFRSLPPVGSAKRVFPNIDAVRLNQNPTWEVLPNQQRNMSFRVTVRDNRPLIGCSDEDDLELQFNQDAGPFTVISPNTNDLWYVGETVEVEWDPANTNNAPINCVFVDIYLSLDGGKTYPELLAEDVPNTGSADIFVPNVPSNDCRIKVKGVDNYFFDISDRDFRIVEPAEPIFLFGVETPILSGCVGDTLEQKLFFTSLAGFDEEVDISLEDAPNGLSVTYTENPVIPSDTLTITLADLDASAAGTYNIKVSAASDSLLLKDSFLLNIYTPLDSVPATLEPVTGATGLSFSPQLRWDSLPNTSGYILEISKDPFFPGNIINRDTLSQAGAQLTNLDPFTVYYWRVKPMNTCGIGDYSNTGSFQTTDNGCRSKKSMDTPIQIDSDRPVTVSSFIEIEEELDITDVDIYVDIDHQEISDLSMSLFSPEGTVISVFTRPCDGGTEIDATFDDSGATFNCSGFGLSGTIQTENGALSSFNGETAKGSWRLLVRDAFDENGGSLEGWRLDICGNITLLEPPVLVTNDTLNVQKDSVKTVSTAHLTYESENTADSLVQFIMTVPPRDGILLNAGDTLRLGDRFTQADISDSLIVYQHIGNNTTLDSAFFDIKDGAGAWLPNQTLNVQIVENTLSIDSLVISDVLCNGDSTGQIAIHASGDYSPFLYLLNDSLQQFNPVFDSLAAGQYEIQVIDRLGFLQDSMNVRVTEPDSLNFTVDQDGGNIELIASGGTPPYTYSIDGINFQSESIFLDLPAGGYDVFVRDANDCLTSTLVIIVNSSVSGNSEKRMIRISPNPGDGYFVLQYEGNEVTFVDRIYVYDVHGLLVKQVTLGEMQPGLGKRIDLTHCSPGLYIIQMKTGNTWIRDRILIQR